MAIPLELGVTITSRGLQVFGMVEEGVRSVGGASAQASNNLKDISRSIFDVMEYLGVFPGELASAALGIENLSLQARVAPAALDALADRLLTMRIYMIEAWQPTLSLDDAVDALTKDQWLLQNALLQAAGALRTQATALQSTGKATADVGTKTRNATTATKNAASAQRDLRTASMQAWNSMNVMSSATQGVMMGMGALQGSLTSVGFGLVFLRWSIPPVTLGIAALVVGVGGLVKIFQHFAAGYEKDFAEPLGRIEDSLHRAFRGLAAPVFEKVLLPLANTFAELAKKIEAFGLKVFQSTEFQEKLAGVIENSQRLIKRITELWGEHGDVLEWLVQEIFNAALNSMNLLIDAAEGLVGIIPSLKLGWEDLGNTVEIVVSPLQSLLDVMAGIGDIGEISLADTLKYFFANIGPTIVGAILGSIIPGVGTAVGALAGTIIGELVKGLDDLLKGGVIRWLEENFSGTFWGAALGATIGSIVPGIGTAVGAIAGAIIGAIVSSLVNGKEEVLYWFKVSVPDWFKRGAEKLKEIAGKITRSPIFELAREIKDAFLAALSEVGDAIREYFDSSLLGKLLAGLSNLKKEVEDWLDRNLKHSIHVGAVPIHMTLEPVWEKGTAPGLDWAPIAKAVSYSAGRSFVGATGSQPATPAVTVSVTGNVFLDTETADKLSAIIEKRIASRLSSLYGRGIV